VVGLRVLVFGGAGLDKEDTSVNLCDLHVLDTPTLAWSQPATHGRPPQERRYHSATAVDGVIYVFGGQYYDAEADLHFEYSNSVHELEVDSLCWRERAIQGAAPLRRACHSAVALGKRVYVVGGRYWDVAEDDYIFLNDIQVRNTPRPLVATTHTTLGKRVYVVGGRYWDVAEDDYIF
jgi:N-acetylneuraminic acid mutarotase